MNYALKDAIAKNESKTCSVTGCNCPRYRLYNTCSHHFFRRKLYGNPKSRAIRKREIAGDRDTVRRLVERNESHQGIQKATTWLDRWLKEATEVKPVPGARHLQRLAYAGITGRDLLITCGALWAYSYRNPKYFPDKLSLVYGLAHQVMTLAPLEYATTRTGKKRAVVMNSTDRKAIGEHIVNNIGILFVNICREIEKQDQEEYEARQAFCEAFV